MLPYFYIHDGVLHSHLPIFISEIITLRLADGEEIHEPVSTLYHQAGVGRPYRRDFGVQEECRWFLCMNPLQSALLSETEFLEMDVTFENCHEFPYLLNVTRFSYITMKCKHDANLLENVPTPLVEMFSSSFIFHAGAVVARVRMTKMTEVAYGAAVKAIFDRCNRENKCDLAQTLKGIIVDWASAQIAGVKDALGKERAEELLRGCKVSKHAFTMRSITKICPCRLQLNFVCNPYRCSIHTCL